MRRTIAILFAMLLVIPMAQAFGDGALASAPEDAERRVTLDLKDTSILDALAVLLKGINYTIGPMQNPPIVTAVVKDVPFASALQVLLRAAGLTARKENGVYFISQVGANADAIVCEELEKQYHELSVRLTDLRKSSPEDSPFVIPVKQEMEKIEQRLLQIRSNKPISEEAFAQREIVRAPPQQPGIKQAEVMEVIRLRYLTTPDIAPMLQSIPNLKSVVAFSLDHSMIVKGTAEAIAEAKRIVGQLDVASAIPQIVRIRLEVTLVDAGTEKPYSLATDSVGAMGSLMDITYQVDGDRLPTGQLAGGIIPTMGSDGKIEIKGEAKFTFHTNDKEFSKSVPVLARVTPGIPVVISSGSSSMGGDATYELLATVTLEGSKPSPAGPVKTVKPAKSK